LQETNPFPSDQFNFHFSCSRDNSKEDTNQDILHTQRKIDLLILVIQVTDLSDVQVEESRDLPQEEAEEAYEEEVNVSLNDLHKDIRNAEEDKVPNVCMVDNRTVKDIDQEHHQELPHMSDGLLNGDIRKEDLLQSNNLAINTSRHEDHIQKEPIRLVILLHISTEGLLPTDAELLQEDNQPLRDLLHTDAMQCQEDSQPLKDILHTDVKQSKEDNQQLRDILRPVVKQCQEDSTHLKDHSQDESTTDALFTEGLQIDHQPAVLFTDTNLLQDRLIPPTDIHPLSPYLKNEKALQ
jgi:hypothetical protein